MYVLNRINTFYRGLTNIFRDSSMFRNSLYLMAGTGVQAVFGFLFWIIAARLYSANEVGFSTALLSATGLIGVLSLLGLDMTLIRFLPGSKHRDRDINNIVTLTTVVATLIAIAFVANLSLFSPKLAEHGTGLAVWLLVIAGSTIITLLAIGNSLFISLRAAKYVAIAALVLSFSKVLSIGLFTHSGGYGPFAAQMVGSLISLIGIFVLLRYAFSIKVKPSLNVATLGDMKGFAGTSYAMSLANGLPGLLLPILILNKLGPSKVAYFYVALMISNALYAIPIATTQSQFAEGSHDPHLVSSHLRQAFKIISIIMVPALLGLFLFGRWILMLFGPDYANNALAVLWILAFSGIFIAINYVLTTMLKVQKRMYMLVLISIITTCSTFIAVYLLIGFGLTGVGIGWLAGEALTSVLLAVAVTKPNWQLSARLAV